MFSHSLLGLSPAVQSSRLARRGAAIRYFCRTTSLANAETATKKKKPKLTKKEAQDFNIRRAAYNRQVSRLRKAYADEIAAERAAGLAEREALQKEATRKALERQRLKNIRSAQNAIKQEEYRQRRKQEFNEHLEREQAKREEKHRLYTAARQLVIDELEKEAPVWLTTPEEVEAAFTSEAEQMLWARPGGVLGAPNPSLDSHFWQNETHTWHMRKTYKTKREVLLEEVREMAYDDANIDKSFWTPERIEKHENMEQRARLRAEVQLAGRRELLRRQAQMLEDDFAAGKGELPKPAPAPNLKMLANERALEREGSRILMEDPTKFFILEHSHRSSVKCFFVFVGK